MRAGRKKCWWLALVLVFALLLGLVALYSKKSSGTLKVAISFLGYTNSSEADGHEAFAVLSVTNCGTASINSISLMSESKSVVSGMASVMSQATPGLPRGKLRSGERKTFAVSQPLRATKWRTMLFYERSTFKQEFRDYLRSHPAIACKLPASWLSFSATSPQVLTETSVWMKAESN